MQLAALGAPEDDWRVLGNKAAAALQWDTATAAYQHLQDAVALAMVACVCGKQAAGVRDSLCQAEVLTHQVLALDTQACCLRAVQRMVTGQS